MIESLKLSILTSNKRMSQQAKDKAGIALTKDRRLAQILLNVSKSHQELEDYISTR
jgi:hypothetical protein